MRCGVARMVFHPLIGKRVMIISGWNKSAIVGIALVISFALGLECTPWSGQVR